MLQFEIFITQGENNAQQIRENVVVNQKSGYVIYEWSLSLKHPKFIDAASVDSSIEEERIGQLKVLTTPDNLQQTFAIIPAKLRLGTRSYITYSTKFNLIT